MNWHEGELSIHFLSQKSLIFVTGKHKFWIEEGTRKNCRSIFWFDKINCITGEHMRRWNVEMLKLAIISDTYVKTRSTVNGRLMISERAHRRRIFRDWNSTRDMTRRAHHQLFCPKHCAKIHLTSMTQKILMIMQTWTISFSHGI